ncbi:hypothetical protein M0811_11749 [Anaeramoeba ignava]|uniref:Uncharacterized protein n=1 Tax=Anaeramoeba ignava TaxID=1746090 RepID=A0A9Q0R6R2_ANAIG|nr:hypothetical protein M0811_11749 [Anaeramoeba ignava]|eukprot:Anaeramoba_ignava/a223580_167.p1 GENE.a223580_167~~a223580_167.p1  ORF type:complete len:460 (-),score=180.07 a223580_167:288-1667(-)
MQSLTFEDFTEIDFIDISSSDIEIEKDIEDNENENQIKEKMFSDDSDNEIYHFQIVKKTPKFQSVHDKIFLKKWMKDITSFKKDGGDEKELHSKSTSISLETPDIDSGTDIDVLGEIENVKTGKTQHSTTELAELQKQKSQTESKRNEAERKQKAEALFNGIDVPKSGKKKTKTVEKVHLSGNGDKPQEIQKEDQEPKVKDSVQAKKQDQGINIESTTSGLETDTVESDEVMDVLGEIQARPIENKNKEQIEERKKKEQQQRELDEQRKRDERKKKTEALFDEVDSNKKGKKNKKDKKNKKGKNKNKNPDQPLVMPMNPPQNAKQNDNPNIDDDTSVSSLDSDSLNSNDDIDVLGEINAKPSDKPKKPSPQELQKQRELEEQKKRDERKKKTQALFDDIDSNKAKVTTQEKKPQKNQNKDIEKTKDNLKQDSPPVNRNDEKKDLTKLNLGFSDSSDSDK